MKLYANFWSILSCLYFHWSIASFILLLCAVNGQFLSCSVICWRWSWVQVWRTGFRPDTIFKLVLRSFQDPDQKPPRILYTSNCCRGDICFNSAALLDKNNIYKEKTRSTDRIIAFSTAHLAGIPLLGIETNVQQLPWYLY